MQSNNINKLIVRSDVNKTDLKSFIRDYFNKKQPATYLPSGQIQCLSYHRRSFSDMYRLCCSYFDCTLQEVAREMINLWEKEKIQCIFCPTTRKAVFFEYSEIWEGDDIIHPKNFNINSPKNIRLTYSKPLTKGTDGYNFVDIYNLAYESDSK